MPAAPLMLAIMNVTAAAKRVPALHEAAFEWRGTGSVVTGWSTGGKTETRLKFMQKGARYVADKWRYVKHRQESHLRRCRTGSPLVLATCADSPNSVNP